jgi:hypothetical protein
MKSVAIALLLMNAAEARMFRDMFLQMEPVDDEFVNLEVNLGALEGAYLAQKVKKQEKLWDTANLGDVQMYAQGNNDALDEQHVNIVFDKDEDLSKQKSKPVEPIGIKLSQTKSNKKHHKKHH